MKQALGLEYRSKEWRIKKNALRFWLLEVNGGLEIKNANVTVYEEWKRGKKKKKKKLQGSSWQNTHLRKCWATQHSDTDIQSMHIRNPALQRLKKRYYRVAELKTKTLLNGMECSAHQLTPPPQLLSQNMLLLAALRWVFCPGSPLFI